MSENIEPRDEQLPLHAVGERLRLAREEKGMTLAQVSAQTRIQQRQLQLIEAGDFDALPARTYAIGFARSYAKVVGLDDKQVAKEVRGELSMADPAERHRAATFEPGDPARVPSRGLAIFSAFAAILLIVGGVAFYQTFFSPASGPGSIVAEEEAQMAAAQRRAGAARPAAGTAGTPTGPVVFTAIEDRTWVKFYDASGKQLMQKEMAKGERYTVPADAEGPQVWTGRPYALAITVGGRPVPKLSEDDVIIKDVPVTPEALLARGQPAAQASAANTAT